MVSVPCVMTTPATSGMAEHLVGAARELAPHLVVHVLAADAGDLFARAAAPASRAWGTAASSARPDLAGRVARPARRWPHAGDRAARGEHHDVGSGRRQRPAAADWRTPAVAEQRARITTRAMVISLFIMASIGRHVSYTSMSMTRSPVPTPSAGCCRSRRGRCSPSTGSRLCGFVLHDAQRGRHGAGAGARAEQDHRVHPEHVAAEQQRDDVRRDATTKPTTSRLGPVCSQARRRTSARRRGRPRR